MALSVGIVGLPNVGKSTVFNALTAGKAEAANYPFCTIDPNVGVVPVPDARLQRIEKHIKTQKVIPAIVEIVDIAGLVKGASQGEGLGNKFLANIRETNAILMMVRCFDDPNVIHVAGSVDPMRDIDVIELELALADVETAEKRAQEGAGRGEDRQQGRQGRARARREGLRPPRRPARPARSLAALRRRARSRSRRSACSPPSRSSTAATSARRDLPNGNAWSDAVQARAPSAKAPAS